MGYDMHMVQPDPEAARRANEARAAFYAAANERDALLGDSPRNSDAARAVYDTDEYKAAQAVVNARAAEMDAADTNYFRLNIWGMSTMREHLHELGMLAIHYAEHPPFPDASDFGLDDDTLDDLGVWDLERAERTTHSDERVRKFFTANLETITWSPPDEPGLPVHKFGSNDGWVVTPRDCKGALVALEQAEKDRPDVVEKIRDHWRGEDKTSPSYFDAFVEFIRQAERTSGFEVW